MWVMRVQVPSMHCGVQKRAVIYSKQIVYKINHPVIPYPKTSPQPIKKRTYI